ncbi:MAG: hypothetical protein ABW189_00810 [Rickettsiales bacterium]
MDKALAALEEEGDVTDYASFLEYLLKNKELTLYRLLSAHAECAEWSAEKIVLRGDSDILAPRLGELRSHLSHAGLSSLPEIAIESVVKPPSYAAMSTSKAQHSPKGKKTEAPTHPDVAYVKKFFPEAILIALDEGETA